MKLIAIVGSLRKESLNRKLFENYKKVVGDQAEIIEGDFSQFPLYNQDIEDKAMPEPVKKLGEMIKGCDGILFFSPEYNYSIPGTVKNMLDWLSRLKDAPYAKKPATILGASPGQLGTARMQYHFRQVAVTLDLRMLNKPEIMVARAHTIFDSNNEITDSKTLELLKKHFDAFKAFVAQNS
jgi:chromate reductase